MKDKYLYSKRLYDDHDIYESTKTFTGNNISFSPKNKSTKLALTVLVLLIANIAAIANSISLSFISNAQGCSGSSSPITVTYTGSGMFFPGNIFTAQLSDSAGDFTNPVDIGSITSILPVPIFATIPAGLPAGSGYQIRVIGSENSNGSGHHITISRNTLPFTVIPSVTPSVSISISSGTNPSCSGSAISFTASATNEGSTPTYQWKVNGIDVGTHSPNFTSSGLSNGDVVHCVMSSNAVCPSPMTVSSNSITMTVNACVPTTRLNNTSCGATGLAISSYIYCIPVPGATDYAYTISNTALGYSVLKYRGSSSSNINLNMFPGLMYGQTYNVSVEAKVGGVWSMVGPVCQITMKPFPPTSLNAVSCGASGLTPASYIYCTAVPGATDYEFSVSNSGLGYSVVKYRGSSSANIQLSNFPGLMYGQSYDVSVKAKVAGVWGPAGAVCQITLMPFPATSLNSTSCGVSGLALTSFIYCTAVAGATDYEFTISSTSLGYSVVKYKGSGTANIKLNVFPGLMYGETYDVAVKAKVAGIWGPNGAVCQITMMPFPSTSLNSTSCGISGISSTAYIYCTAVTGATDYEFTLTNASLGYSMTKYRGSNAANIRLTNFTGLMAGETYDVSVKAKVSGVWGPNGPICQITLAGSALAGAQEADRSVDAGIFTQQDTPEQSIAPLRIYPNPVSGSSSMKIETSSTQTQLFILTDLLGRTVFEKRCAAGITEINLSEMNIQPGIYNLSAISETNTDFYKISITK